MQTTYGSQQITEKMVSLNNNHTHTKNEVYQSFYYVESNMAATFSSSPLPYGHLSTALQRGLNVQSMITSNVNTKQQPTNNLAKSCEKNLSRLERELKNGSLKEDYATLINTVQQHQMQTQ